MRSQGKTRPYETNAKAMRKVLRVNKSGNENERAIERAYQRVNKNGNKNERAYERAHQRVNKSGNKFGNQRENEMRNL